MKKYREITDFRSHHEVLIKPLSLKELTDKSTNNNIISEKVLVDFNDLVAHGIDWLNNHVSEKITGSDLGLMDISFKVAGRTPDNEIILKVTGEIDFDGLL